MQTDWSHTNISASARLTLQNDRWVPQGDTQKCTQFAQGDFALGILTSKPILPSGRCYDIFPENTRVLGMQLHLFRRADLSLAEAQLWGNVPTLSIDFLSCKWGSDTCPGFGGLEISDSNAHSGKP
jgi:hypothetical protein